MDTYLPSTHSARQRTHFVGFSCMPALHLDCVREMPRRCVCNISHSSDDRQRTIYSILSTDDDNTSERMRFSPVRSTQIQLAPNGLPLPLLPLSVCASCPTILAFDCEAGILLYIVRRGCRCLRCWLVVRAGTSEFREPNEYRNDVLRIFVYAYACNDVRVSISLDKSQPPNVFMHEQHLRRKCLSAKAHPSIVHAIHVHTQTYRRTNDDFVALAQVTQKDAEGS